MPSSGAASYAVTFGIGLGGSVAAPGDYDGDGKTDIAVYLPSLGVLAYRTSSTSATAAAVALPFGIPGAGQTLVAPGDYDGDGKTDVAAFFPASGIFAYRPSAAAAGSPDVYTRFGPDRLGLAVPVPGDYDGDGKSDVALFLPSEAVYAVLPSGGATPYAQQFGYSGAANTVPATVVVPPESVFPTAVSAASLRAATPADPNAGLVVYYQPDAVPAAPATRRKPLA